MTMPRSQALAAAVAVLTLSTPADAQPPGPGGPGGFGPGGFLAPQVMAVADLDKDGLLTAKEAGAAAERFVRDAGKEKKHSLNDQALARAISDKLGPGGPGGGRRPGGPGRGPGGPGGGPGSFLAPQIVRGADADKDGTLSPEEAREAAERLVREADKANKGGLDVAALTEAINRRVSPPEGFGGPGGPGGGLAALAPKILAYADADKDGRLTPDEASAAAARFVKEADTDHEGSLAFAPLLKALGSRGGPMGPGSPEYPPRGHGAGDMQAIQVMRLVDADHDDHIAPEEASKLAGTLVRQADSAGKGSIDLDTLKAFLTRQFRFGPGPGGPPPGGRGPGGPR